MGLWFHLLLLQLLLYVHRNFAIPVETKDEALSYLTKYGYNTCKNTSNVTCNVDVSSLIKKFQNFYGLNKTGILDAATKQLMSKPRCGNSDTGRNSQSNAYKKWSKKSLTWSLRGRPNEFTFEKTESIMKWAFEYWADHIPIKIKKNCATCNANIIIDFVYESHGDTYPFDGPGGTLAHANFPEDGRIHFDKDEKWNDGFTNGRSLYVAAVHEIGHALGFDHQRSIESIMHPINPAMPSNKVLLPIDRTLAQNLYGHQYPSMLKNGQHLNMTQQLRSPNGNYTLIMQKDGDLVIYKHYLSVCEEFIWASGTKGRGISPYHAILQNDGNFVVYDGSQNKILQTSSVAGTQYTFLKIEDDGTLALYKHLTAPKLVWRISTQNNFVVDTTTTTEYTVESFQKAFPNDTIVAFKYKSGGYTWFYGTELLEVILTDGYWLAIYKFTQSSGINMTSDEIKLIADPFIHKTKDKKDASKRHDILQKDLEDAFPDHFVNIFIFHDDKWNSSVHNTLGFAYYEMNYGCVVDIVLT